MSTKKTATVVKPQRLTNTMRDVFVAAVMADVPKVDYETAVHDAVQKAAMAAVPPAVKKLLASDDTKGWVRTEYFELGPRNGLPRDIYVTFTVPGSSDTKAARELAAEAIASLAKEWCEQVEQHNKLRSTLRIAADRCTTTTQLAETFPEFAKYLPQSEADATRNLPAIANLVTEFTRAGWPKGNRLASA